MVRRLRGRHPLGLIATGVVITLVLSGTAIAVTDASFTYSTVQTGYMMIGPADLVPEDTADASDYTIGSIGASTSSYACFRAPVHLPQGARMTSVRTSYVSGGGSNPYLDLRRTNPVTGAQSLLIARNVVDDSGNLTFVNDTVPADRALVSNALFTYTYQVCVGTHDSFIGARIAYTYTSAGD